MIRQLAHSPCLMYIEIALNKENNIYRISDMEKMERPRERMFHLGPQALNTAELLAILLRVGVKGENAVQVGHRLLNKFGGLRGLHQASIDIVEKQHGIGKAKASTIKAAIELGRRLSLEAPEEKPAINSPGDAAALVQYEMSGYEQENLKVISLNMKNQVIGINDLYQGSLNSSLIRVGEVFKFAVRNNAASILVVHNHPSGDPTPSKEDINVTREIVSAGKLLDIEVLDHLIIGGGSYISLKEKGLGF